MLDIEQPEQLVRFLRRRGEIASTERPIVRALSGGVSNRTVYLEREDGEAWVLKQALEKLRVSVDWFSSPERVHREADGLRWLARVAPEGTITPLIFEDHKHHVIAMDAVPQPHENWKVLLLAGQLQMDHVVQFGSLLAAIHANAWQRRDEVAPQFADRSFYETLRLEPYYGYTAEQLPGATSFMHMLMDETRRRTLTLVHGDYSPKNVLIYDGRLILLDHEVIHWGDPAFDVGFSVAHLLSKAHHLPEHRADFAEATRIYWQTYQEALIAVPWTDDLEKYAVRHSLACLLARVVGRSPLEYLQAEERQRQQRVLLRLIQAPPGTMVDLVGQFVAGLTS